MAGGYSAVRFAISASLRCNLSFGAPFLDDIVFGDLAVQGHAGPVEFLGGAAFVPVGFKQDGQDPATLFVRVGFRGIQLRLDIFRQTNNGFGAIGQVDVNCFQEI